MLRYLALGDSYTVGTGVRPTDAWPWQLISALRSVGFTLADPVIIAQNGWTSDDLLAGISNADPVPGFDLISLLIGVNDQYRNHPLVHYEEVFAELLDNALDLCESSPEKMVVLSIPDWSVTPFANGCQRDVITTEIDSFNDTNRLVSQRVGCHYVDLTRLSRAIGGDPNWLADDGLHPNAEFYQQWIELVLPTARKILSKGLEESVNDGR